mmetsp:Transcript_49817/g.92093  ORF Transcript_49817/g.92093 Transcript_49817/m.92093 type:complete len:238 (+) Transcript_49817:1453-2166(+)
MLALLSPVRRACAARMACARPCPRDAGVVGSESGVDAPDPGDLVRLESSNAGSSGVNSVGSASVVVLDATAVSTASELLFAFTALNSLCFASITARRLGSTAGSSDARCSNCVDGRGNWFEDSNSLCFAKGNSLAESKSLCFAFITAKTLGSMAGSSETETTVEDCSTASLSTRATPVAAFSSARSSPIGICMDASPVTSLPVPAKLTAADSGNCSVDACSPQFSDMNVSTCSASAS